MMNINGLVKLLLLFFIFLNSALARADKQIGVFYFPGWKNAPEIIKSEPWEIIKKFPEREPLLGWYRDGSDDVAVKHLDWMKSSGLSFVAYDWYWLNAHGVSLNHAIDAYRRVAPEDAVRYTILWANHSDVPSSVAQFDEIVDYWIANYFNDSRYLKIDGKPVVFIFSPSLFSRDAKRAGTSAIELLNRARKKAEIKGGHGIYFVAAVQAVKDVVQQASLDSYDALSAYNYHAGYSGYDDGRLMSRSYEELIAGYSESWKWIMENSTLPYIVPLTSGWDKRPWGGSKDPLHDNSKGDPIVFRKHLEAARDVLEKNPEKTLGMSVICCWNEFGEGSYIEPTKLDGLKYLESIKSVFGTK